MLGELRAAATAAGIGARVHFLGYVNGADKSGIYRLAKLLVVPSRQEAMSIVALEAGICGTPALVTDQCGFREVRGVDERLEAPASVAGIAHALESLLAQPAELERLSPLWRAFVEREYSWSALVGRYIALYRQTLADNPKEAR
jgi:glycosyltransferase involved in cell wall biosynthesis